MRDTTQDRKSEPARLVVMISGQGSNLQAIIEACRARRLNATIEAVVSNNPNAYGLIRANSAGLKTVVLVPSSRQSRVDYDRALAVQVAALQPDWIVLAGWMRILTAAFLENFPSRVINLHPALPHCFPGTHAIKRALAAYQRGEIQVTGVMLHIVSEVGIDCGPVLAQHEVPIYSNDDLASLTARMHQAEHRLLIHTLQTLVHC